MSRWSVVLVAREMSRGPVAAAVSALSVPSVASASTEDARDGLLLVFEELASNALRHGGGDVRALVVAGPEGWLLDLSDVLISIGRTFRTA